MAKLPGVADLGPAPRADETRPVARYDVSSYARGGQALAQGEQALGQGVARAGEGLGELALDSNRWDQAKAHSYFLAKKVDLDFATTKDTNYGPDETGKTLPQRYEDQLTQLRDESAALIADPRMRARFATELQPTIARGKVAAVAHATKLDNDAWIAYVHQQGDNLTNKAIGAADDYTRRQLIVSHNQLVDGLVAKGAITQVQAVTMKQAWAHQYATADLLARADSDPEGVINVLRLKPGSPEAITNRILKIEGTSANPSSSAVGAGQFIKSTWLDMIKRYRPELAQGRGDADILALRADPRLGREMTEAYRRENEATLRHNGIEATPGAQYLAHFLGPGGAVAVLKADPNMPVADALAKAVGSERARAMVAANPSILAGRLSGSVTAWADAKMGGVDGGGGSIYAMLRPDVREQILAKAQAQLHKRTVEDFSGFQQRVKDTETEAMRTGAVAAPIPKEDFIARAGVELGEKAYEQHQATVQLGHDIQAVAQLDPQEQQELLQRYEPQPGEGYADQGKRRDIVAKAIEKARKERDDDPAGFAIARLPASGEAFKRFAAVTGDPTASEGDRQAAARDYANRTLMEQGRIGVPEADRRIVPASYLERLLGALENPQTLSKADGSKGTPADAARLIEREARIWGDQWPLVSRDIQGTATIPVVRVLAAGVSAQAAMVLPSLISTPLADILKGRGDESIKVLKTEVDKQMRTFAASMLGTKEQTRYFADYVVAGEKLAAWYVLNGKSASDAAEEAFKHTLGHKYEFVSGGLFKPWGASYGTVRIPKDIGISPGKIADGAEIARGRLDAFNLQPGTVDRTAAASAREFARDGVWATAAGDGGLWLVLDGQVAAKQDGSPLILTWKELAGFADQAAAERERRTRGARELGALPRG